MRYAGPIVNADHTGRAVNLQSLVHRTDAVGQHLVITVRGVSAEVNRQDPTTLRCPPAMNSRIVTPAVAASSAESLNAGAMLPEATVTVTASVLRFAERPSSFATTVKLAFDRGRTGLYDQARLIARAIATIDVICQAASIIETVVDQLLINCPFLRHRPSPWRLCLKCCH